MGDLRRSQRILQRSIKKADSQTSKNKNTCHGKSSVAIYAWDFTVRQARWCRMRILDVQELLSDVTAPDTAGGLLAAEILVLVIHDTDIVLDVSRVVPAILVEDFIVALLKTLALAGQPLGQGKLSLHWKARLPSQAQELDDLVRQLRPWCLRCLRDWLINAPAARSRSAPGDRRRLGGRVSSKLRRAHEHAPVTRVASGEMPFDVFQRAETQGNIVAQTRVGRMLEHKINMHPTPFRETADFSFANNRCATVDKRV